MVAEEAEAVAPYFARRERLRLWDEVLRESGLSPLDTISLTR